MKIPGLFGFKEAISFGEGKHGFRFRAIERREVNSFKGIGGVLLHIGFFYL